ncbi:MAG TPA: tetratricopeptide repeat protein [Ramlibacter sp.]|uniref:type III secretion apparatus assembly chaperone SctY n=1 Tax=Ramlibacter sp. TaxID=1917967 RepID=UPI002BD0EA60|nr:tetratricopeptide repeat protein [Ramlibacter sp.]HVZ45047.1 tetratricopeptide repeat protein [Ramlibacter sp.]
MERFQKDSLDVMRLLGHVFLLHGRPDQALVILRALCVLAPDDRRALRSLALAALRAGQPSEAARVLDKLRDSGDPSPVLHLLHGQALVASGRQAEAERAFSRFTAERAAEQNTLES